MPGSALLEPPGGPLAVLSRLQERSKKARRGPLRGRKRALPGITPNSVKRTLARCMVMPGQVYPFILPRPPCSSLLPPPPIALGPPFPSPHLPSPLSSFLQPPPSPFPFSFIPSPLYLRPPSPSRSCSIASSMPALLGRACLRSRFGCEAPFCAGGVGAMALLAVAWARSALEALLNV